MSLCKSFRAPQIVLFTITIAIITFLAFYKDRMIPFKLNACPEIKTYLNLDHLLHKSEKRTLVAMSSAPSTYPQLETHFRDTFNKTFSSQVEVGPDTILDPAKYLIYRCDAHSMRSCGGWADRVKGMLSGYLIANLTGRVFKIEVLSPSCDIQQVLVPNLVNWSLPVSFHKVVQKSNDVQILNLLGHTGFNKKASTVDFQTLPEMTAKYVYYKNNLDFMMGLKNSERYKRELSWMRDLSRDEINAAIFKRLFNPPFQIRRKLYEFFSANLNPSDKLLCAHVRTGRNPSIPHDTETRVKDDDLPKIWNLLQKVSRGAGEHKIFLMSDSENVIMDAKNQSFQDKIIFNHGRVVHIERSRDVATEDICTGLEKVVFEQFILMHCDVLVISKSGLGRMAAYVRGSNKDLYCILLDGVGVVPCDKAKLQELYHIYG